MTSGSRSPGVTKRRKRGPIPNKSPIVSTIPSPSVHASTFHASEGNGNLDHINNHLIRNVHQCNPHSHLHNVNNRCMATLNTVKQQQHLHIHNNSHNDINKSANSCNHNLTQKQICGSLSTSPSPRALPGKQAEEGTMGNVDNPRAHHRHHRERMRRMLMDNAKKLGVLEQTMQQLSTQVAETERDESPSINKQPDQEPQYISGPIKNSSTITSSSPPSGLKSTRRDNTSYAQNDDNIPSTLSCPAVRTTERQAQARTTTEVPVPMENINRGCGEHVALRPAWFGDPF